MTYKEILNRLKESFPEPISSSEKDNILIQYFQRALQQATDLKGEGPLLGEKEADLEPLYLDAKQKKLHPTSSTVAKVTRQLVNYLEGMTIWGHPLTQENVIPPPTIAALVGNLLATLYNPLITSDEYSHKVALAENEVSAIVSSMIGYDPKKSIGISTFGGTITVLYAMKVALEKIFEEHTPMALGFKNLHCVIFTSEHSHYCVQTAAGWLGVGTESVIKIPGYDDHSINLEILEQAFLLAIGKHSSEDTKFLEENLDPKHYEFLCQKSPVTVLAINATIGTTDHFGIDDIKSIVSLRDRLKEENNLEYTPHVHADAAIGWAWASFKDYFGPDEEEDELKFNKCNENSGVYEDLVKANRRIRHMDMADSVGIDFHKTGFAPAASSMILFKNGINVEGEPRSAQSYLLRDKKEIPYLFHNANYHPGSYTLETTRSGAGVLSALANLKLFGKEGFQAIIGHLVSMRRKLSIKLNTDSHITTLNKNNHGTVTLFRVYPDSIKTPIIEGEKSKFSYLWLLLYCNAYNKCIADYLHNQAIIGHSVILSRTEKFQRTRYINCPNEKFSKLRLPIVALKSFILSPFVDDASIDLIKEGIISARKNVAFDDIEKELLKHVKDVLPEEICNDYNIEDYCKAIMKNVKNRGHQEVKLDLK